VVVWGGTSEVGKNDTINGLNEIKEVLRRTIIPTLFRCVFHTDLIYKKTHVLIMK
jgi:hypothetical protein